MKKADHMKKIFHNRISLIVEILLTLSITISVISMSLSNLTSEAGQFSKDLESDYNVLFESYITTFELLTGQIIEKIEEDPTFDEMQQWLQSKEAVFNEQVGDIYNGVALTYKGGYAHSWNYGEYSDYDPTARPWFQQAQEADGEVTIVAPYVTYLDPSYFADDDYILMTIAQKYNDEISFDYDIKIMGIRRMLESREFQYDSANVIFYDKEGYILSSNFKEQFAHNIYTVDDIVTQELSEKVADSAKNLERLDLEIVDGEWKILYSTKDGNENTVCILYSFWEVVQKNFAMTCLVAFFLILFEIFMYYKDKGTILEFRKRDARLSCILEASYEKHISVDVATMKFSGGEVEEKLARGDDYTNLYVELVKMMGDEESKKQLEEFMSPEVLKTVELEHLETKKFNVYRIIEGNKKPFVYEISRMVTMTEGKIVANLLANDVTEDVAILKEALKRAEQASQAKGTFLTKMSHEIRTPMNAIIGETTLAIKNIQKQEKVEECLKKVMISSRHLLNLINDVLDMSSIESNKMKIAKVEFDIKDIVSTVTTLYYSQCREKGVSFEAKLENVTTEILVGDQLRLQQVILNLLSNAYKFTPSGGNIVFHLEEEIIAPEQLVLHLSVQDTGCGMSAEYMNRIFKPFEQETELTAKEHGGSGLGLSISKNLVEMMGGTINVESKEGVGTTFFVQIPCMIADSQNRVDREAVASMRAILVDDDKDALEYASSILNHIGIDYDCAQSGEEAVSLITKARNDKKMYNVCLADWRMKGITGIELTEKIRKACGEEPIVMVASAYDLNEISAEADKAGVDACITKPLFQSSLFNILMTLSQGKLVKRTAEPESYDFTGKRLLLVDDTEFNREIAQELLEMVGFQVDTAKDGKEGVEIFENSQPGTYQIILMDVQMPVMNGYEATQAIRSSHHPDAKSTCIIAMTANAFAEDITKSLEAGMNDHISKPIDTELMYEVLNRYLNEG